jgi:hypothetical protein
MYGSVWVPGKRAEPFFPLNPRRPCWTMRRTAATGLPAARLAACARSGIIRSRSQPCGSLWPAVSSRCCLTVPAADRQAVDPGIDIQVDDAVCRAGVIRGRSPWPAEQFDLTQLFQRNTSPVRRRSRRTETTLALAAILITENPSFALAVAPQPMWIERGGKRS